MTTGKVDWFNDLMGFGIVAPDNGNKELFAPFYTSDLNGLNRIKEGQKVIYEVVQGPKGKRATNIQVSH